jgi:hypothetical protein
LDQRDRTGVSSLLGVTGLVDQVLGSNGDHSTESVSASKEL